MVRKEWLVVILLSLGIIVGFIVSAIVTFTLDQGRQYGSAFSLVHHFTEAIGFFILSVGFGVGFNMDNVRIRSSIRAASMVVLLFYTLLAMLQTKGVQLPIGVPLFVPLIIMLGLVAGYGIGRCVYPPIA